MKIKKYKIVYVSEVQKYIDNGWQPWGSPVFNSITGIEQAMVKYDPREMVRK